MKVSAPYNALFISPIAQNLLFYSLIVVGFIFGIGGVVLFNKANTTVNPHKIEKANELVTVGVYKLTRNPMYLGLVLSLCAIGLRYFSIWSILSLIGFIMYMTIFQIIPEEKAMTKLFGARYLQYKSKVRRWI
jgi:protein-S-isoprenylcysteine O-methyltransferase Ste14